MSNTEKKAFSSLREAMLKTAKKDMPKFLDQNRPEKVKEIYRALKRDHPEMSAEMKARIASKKGTQKKAYAAAAVSGGGNNSVLNWNDSGGLMPVNEEDRQRGGNANLRTLPQDVEGASCATCKYFKVTDEGQGLGLCQEPEIRQDVTVRMLCYSWDNPGVIPVVDEEEQAQQDMQAEQDQQDAEAEEAMAAGEAPEGEGQQQGGGSTAEEKKPAKKPAEPQKTASLMDLVNEFL